MAVERFGHFDDGVCMACAKRSRYGVSMVIMHKAVLPTGTTTELHGYICPDCVLRAGLEMAEIVMERSAGIERSQKERVPWPYHGKRPKMFGNAQVGPRYTHESSRPGAMCAGCQREIGRTEVRMDMLPDALGKYVALCQTCVLAAADLVEQRKEADDRATATGKPI